ncbi:MAG: type IV secretion system DNA-binding domain-containing protein [Candidatus Parcubacteria bacterium]|nr:type IV secretion system DNA-binding domain-containing protein [Candidatus Parcubacteria bacterium]
MDPHKITYFAKADFRNKMTEFGIKAEDRTRHVYVIGKTGMGKSTLLENMVVQDIQSGNGCAFIDPHGGTAELLLDYVPEHRIKDVIYFAPFDTDYPVAFNIMEDVGKDKRHLVAAGLMSAFKKIWVDAWSARMEYILSNTLLALLEFPGATLLGVNRMYSDKDYRKKVVDNITDPSIKSFWVDEYAKYGERYTQEATPAIQNKVGQFVSNPLIRNIIGQSKSTFDIREVMDSKKILIMNLSKGRVGDQNTSLLGSMLITKIYLAAMSRADASRSEMSELPPFYFFVDEFQSFANESFADILSEARKYKLNLTIAHQYIEQMPEEVRAAVFGNVGTMITFRVGSYDADVLEKEFLPAFSAEDIVNLDKYQLYLKLMIDGVGSRPFSAVALPPIKKEGVSFKEQILANSRNVFAKKREDVEKEIMEWHEMSFAEKKNPVIPSTFTPPSGGFSASPSFTSPKPLAEAGFHPTPSQTPQTFRPQKQPYRPAPGITGNTPVRPPFVPRNNPPVQREIPQEQSARAYERKSEPVERRSTPRIATHTEQVRRDIPPQTPSVSLSSLRRDATKMPEPSQNRNSLKEALQSILPPKETQNAPQKKEDIKKSETPVREIPQTPTPTTTPASTQSAVKEIPEDVLKGMLKVEE